MKESIDFEKCFNCNKSKKDLRDQHDFKICVDCFQILKQQEMKYRNLKTFKKPDFICDNIYLGEEASAIDLQYLQKNNINRILLVAEFGEQKFPQEIQYKQIKIDDSPHENIEQYFEDCFKFIKQDKKNVLIHCISGISRSATIVIAYLMYSQKMNFEDAWKYLKTKRSCVYPNSGFQKQLKNFEYKFN